ncbi:MAG: NADH:ubiquinone oxidoreductase [Candidatus Odinarchaeota archaeon]|nr:NADH:ubiquinone oxidoreductase [Candidatus Odinarchaeota archaeon]
MKMKVGIFSLSSCEGCLVQILNLEDEIIDLLKAIEVSNCRILGEVRSDGELDLAIIEGSVTNDEEEEELKEIRERSRILLALGDCACHGGKSIVKDYGYDEVEVSLPRGVKNFKSDPLDKYVKVDYYVYGCPIDRRDFLEAFKSILIDKKYVPKSYNVCAECILRENECLLEKGILCLGPITRGGCRALCPSFDRECVGCRGISEDANIESFLEIVESKGIKIPNDLKMLEKFKAGRDDGKDNRSEEDH